MYGIFSSADLKGKKSRHNNQSSAFVIDPSSQTYLWLSSLEMVLLTYDLIVIPLLVSNLDPPETVVSLAWTYFSLFFWTIDMPLSFITGFVTWDGEVELRFLKCAAHYAKTRFIWDLSLLTIEWVNFSIQTFASSAEFTSSGRLLRIMRFSRLIKVGKMQRIMQTLLQRVRSNVMLTAIGIIKAIICLVLSCHLFACGWSLCRGEEDDTAGVSDTAGGFIRRYAEALNWSFSQLGFATTDMLPETALERSYTNLVSLLCLTLWSVMLGTVFTLLSRLQMLLKAQREREERLREYMGRHRVSWSMRNRIWHFLRRANNLKEQVLETDVEMIRSLTQTLALELRAEVFIPILTVHPFFGTYAVSQADSYAMQQLVETWTVQEQFIDVERELFLEGAAAMHMYFVTQGCIMYRCVRDDGASGLPQTPSKNSTSGTTRLSKGQTAPHLAAEWSSWYSDDRCTPVHPGMWMCEIAIWLHWEHVGTAFARTHCNVVTIEADKFKVIMQRQLPQAKRYALLFMQYAKEGGRALSDLCKDLGRIRVMAQEVFDPPLCFSVELCYPVETASRKEWNPSGRRIWQQVWSTTWKEEHRENQSALIAAIATDLKHDAILMYQTLFAQNLAGAQCPVLTPDEAALHDKRVLFLKRLLLAIALCGLCYSKEPNGARRQPWPYPLASALSHGGRILVNLLDVNWKRFVSFLVDGDPDSWSDGSVPAPLYNRRAGSHKVAIHPLTSELQEATLKKMSSVGGSNHMGMDLPLGGFGNPAPTHKQGNLMVGHAGVPFRLRRRSGKEEYVSQIQHGHLYIRWDEFGTRSHLALKRNATAGRFGLKKSLFRRGSADTDSAGLRRGSRSQIWDSDEEQWTPLQLLKKEDLMIAVEEHGWARPFTADEDSGRLYDLLSKSQELVLETSQEGGLRCRGILVFLTIQYQTKVLVHKAALAESMRLDDSRILTAVCSHHEEWAAAVTRYAKEVLLLDDTAVESLLDSCFEGQAEAYMTKCTDAGTACHHHLICRSMGLLLEYDALHLKCQLDEKDHSLFASILDQTFQTVEESQDLRGFGTLTTGVGAVTREWEWVPKENISREVAGWRWAEQRAAVRLNKEARQISSLLIGIESSAPMKEDLFGGMHGPDAKSKSTSAFGKRKWRDYVGTGVDIPAHLGGMEVKVDICKFQVLMDLCESLNLCKPSDGALFDSQQQEEMEFFRTLLQDGDAQNSSTILDRMSFLGEGRASEISQLEGAENSEQAGMSFSNSIMSRSVSHDELNDNCVFKAAEGVDF